MIDSNNHIISRSLFAGICISVGGFTFLSSASPIVGAILFSTGLLACSVLNLNLFTDKSGFLSDSKDLRRLILVLLLNLFAAFVFGLITRFFETSVSSAANSVLTAQFNTGYFPCIIRSTITGFLMTLAMCREPRQNTNYNSIIIILCAFAAMYLGGFHCILESFYYGASTVFYDNIGDLLLRLLIIVVFNFIGCSLYNLFIHRSFIHNPE